MLLQLALAVDHAVLKSARSSHLAEGPRGRGILELADIGIAVAKKRGACIGLLPSHRLRAGSRPVHSGIPPPGGRKPSNARGVRTLRDGSRHLENPSALSRGAYGGFVGRSAMSARRGAPSEPRQGAQSAIRVAAHVFRARAFSLSAKYQPTPPTLRPQRRHADDGVVRRSPSSDA